MQMSPRSSASREAPDSGRWTALMICASQNDARLVKRMCDAGADIDATNQAGQTALMIASLNGHVVNVRVLCDAGASVNSTTKQLALTPLMLATVAGHTDVVQLLIARGANVNATEYVGFTALMIACATGHLAIVKVLCEHLGVDEINMRNNNGWTAVMLASYYGFTEIVERLSKLGADLCAEEPDGSSALIWAASGNHPAVLKRLLLEGATTAPCCMLSAKGARLQDAAGQIHHAVQTCTPECAVLLLASGLLL
jgi:ankyrin repeat protein